MKPRTVLPFLLLTLAFFAPHQTARAQTNKDWVYITNNPYDLNGWRLSFHHFGPILTPVTAITLTLDTTAFPNVRFDGSTGDAGPDSAQYGWFYYSSVNADSNWWCNSTGNSIPHNQSDSFFVFGLMQVNPNIPINDSPVTIHWSASFESNNCEKYGPISSGSFQVIPTAFQSYPPYDTMTATTSTPLCDPLFNFTVRNQNGLKSNIGTVKIEFLDQFSGSMRPSDVSAPPGWKVDSVTPYSATFSEGGNNYIPVGSSLGNFVVGLSADPSTTAYDFALWTYDNGDPGLFIDRDTSWGIPATAKSCSLNSSDDTLRVTNNLGCAFDFNVGNSHSVSAQVSPITKVLMHITKPGVTWSSASTPLYNGVPVKNWSFVGLGTSTLSWQTPTESSGQPGGVTWTYPASIDDPVQGELVTLDWIDSDRASATQDSVETSSGTDTFRCEAPPTPDSAAVVALGNCEYEVIVKNTHVPTSGVKQVLFTMPPTGYGAFAPPYSSNTNWGSNLGNGLEFSASGGNGIKSGATDTFYFSIAPMQPNTPWPLTFIDYDALTGNTITDSTINDVPGCTPPVICDTVTFKRNRTPDLCVDTMTVDSRAIGSGGIDSIWVIPMDGWKVVSASKPIPWDTTISAMGDTLLYFGGNVNESTSRVFVLSFNADTSLHGNFDVQVITHDVNGLACTSIATMSCAGSLAVTPSAPVAPLLLSIAPNPLRDQTDITLTTGATDRVQMVLLNVLGQTERNVVDQMLAAGEHSYTLDASALPAGTYYLRLETNGQVLTKKLVIEK